MKKLILNKNKKIHYNIDGKGETLVFLHGFMEDLNMWQKHTEELSQSFQVVSIDLPGHGKSDVYGESHSMELMAETVHAVLTVEQVKKCVLIGHSMGGYVSLAFADKYPEMMNGIGLFHSHSLDDSEEVKRNRDRTIGIVNANKSHFISQFIPSLFAEDNRERFKVEINRQIELANQMDPKGITAALEGMKIRPMRLDILAFSNIPVLFILGKKDSKIPLDQALAQAAAAKFAQVTILGNSGHMGWLEDSSKTIAAINGFMNFCKT